jgi:hypothetical protein
MNPTGKAASGADIAEWHPEDEQFWESSGKKIAYRNLWLSIPALLCGFAVWGMWGIITVQMLNLGFPFSQGRALHPDRHRRHLGRHHAHPGVLPDPDGGWTQHHLPDHRHAAGACHWHRHCTAAQGLAAVGVPADGAVVGRGRWQTSPARCPTSAPSSPSACRAPHWGPERRSGQLRRDDHADRHPLGHDGELLRPDGRAHDAGEGQRLDPRQDRRRGRQPGCKTRALPGLSRSCRCPSCAGLA